MRWINWLLIGFIVSVVGHTLMERVWLVSFFRKLDDLGFDQAKAKIDSLSTVKRQVLRYACYNGKSKGVIRVLLPLLAVVWVPVLAAFAVVAGVFGGLGMV